MAKGIIPLRAFRGVYKRADRATIGDALYRAFTEAIHGEDDALIPVDLGAEIAATIPNCPFHRIAGMGHIITPALAPKIVDLADNFIQHTE